MLIPVRCLGSVLVLFIVMPCLSILWHQRQNDYEYSYTDDNGNATAISTHYKNNSVNEHENNHAYEKNSYDAIMIMVAP